MLVALTIIFFVLFCIYFLGLFESPTSENSKNIKKMNLKFMFRLFWNFIFVLKPEDRLCFIREIHANYPGSLIFKIWNRNYFICYDPEIMKKIFLSTVAQERPLMEYIKFDAGLVCTKYHKWKVDRKNLNSAFNLNILKGYVPVFAEKCEDTMKDLEVHVDEKEFNFLYYSIKLTTRVSFATITNVNELEVDINKLIQTIHECMELISRRMVNPFLQPEWIYKRSHLYRTDMLNREFYYALVDELIYKFKKQRKLDKTDGKKSDIKFIMEFLMDENGVKYSDIEIREHILTLLLLGVETSGNLLANAILYLAVNPNIQDDLYEEIKAVFGDIGVDLEYETINRLQLLDRVVKETLRLSSPAPITIRQTFDDLNYGEGVLPKGTIIVLDNFLLHTREDIWGKNSLKFDPDNFLPENVAKRHPYSFVPFGGGARNCIGNRYAMISIKIFMIKFIKRYQFSSSLKEKDLKFKLTMTCGLVQDHMVSIKKRI